nr:hypothetical protein [Streptomyces fodineus]
MQNLDGHAGDVRDADSFVVAEQNRPAGRDIAAAVACFDPSGQAEGRQQVTQGCPEAVGDRLEPRVQRFAR